MGDIHLTSFWGAPQARFKLERGSCSKLSVLCWVGGEIVGAAWGFEENPLGGIDIDVVDCGWK